MAKNPLELIDNMVKEDQEQTNKYNLVPTKDIRPVRMGSMSQEVGSSYNNLSDLYGIDLNDLVHGDKGFMKTKYPQGFPDFQGDVIYSDKYWKEFEDWANKEKGIDWNDRRWERYKLDPDYFENSFDREKIDSVRKYAQGLEPDHEILKREPNYMDW